MLSRENIIVKSAIKLKQKKYREREGLFIAEGLRFVGEALKAGLVKQLFYSDKALKLQGFSNIINSVSSYEVDDNIIEELSDTENPQGIAAVVEKPSLSFEEIKNDSIVIIDRIQDPGNMGTIIRTCDALGVGGVFIIKGSVDTYNSKTLRSTMGSIFHIPVINFDSFSDGLEYLKKRDYRIFASSLMAEKFIYQCDFKGKCAIVIGNEAQGMEKEDISLCNESFKIPMTGEAESLNAAAASSIIIYEVLRQRLTGR